MVDGERFYKSWQQGEKIPVAQLLLKHGAHRLIEH